MARYSLHVFRERRVFTELEESMGKFLMAVCFASIAFGQNADRVFHLTNATAVMSLQDIATTLRSVAQIQQVSVDSAAAMLTVKGTPDQIALADWLIPKLDVPAASNAAPLEYRVSGNSEDVMAVCGLVHTISIRGAEEIVTTVRTVVNIQKIFLVAAPAILTLRGNADQIALAESLVSELDQTPQPRQNATVHELKLSDDTVVVYGLAHTIEPQSIQEVLVILRTVLDIQRLFEVTEPKLLAIRCNPSQVQMVEWLLPLLDRTTADGSGSEARMPGGNDDVVHVFYLSHLTDLRRMNGLLTDIRKTVYIQKAFTRSTPPALVLRGTADQIATAGRMIESSDHSAP